MSRRSASAPILAIAATVAVWSASAIPIGAAQAAGLSMEVLVDGTPLTEYPTHDRTYIEALEAREYSIRLTNQSGRRVAVALSVDGLNTIDAKHTSAGRAAKWILDPHASITIDGWQTGSSTARRFFFTTEEASYGAWLGRVRDLGLIAAAVFREKTEPPSPVVTPRESRRIKSAPSEAREMGAESELSDEMAATGIGRQIDHRVRRVQFDAESHPAGVVELRYEYRPELSRLGILPRCVPPPIDPLARREGSTGFSDTGFAPDPYR